MELIILAVLLIASLSANVAQRHALINRPDRVEYKEIEVVKRAMCECGHISSVHKDGRGSCRQQLFKLEGRITTKSYECFCTKYTGPLPVSEYFDDQLRELDTVRAKELE